MKKTKISKDSQRLYLGVDVGGTKVQACLVEECGTVLERKRAATPRDGGPEAVLATLDQVIAALLQSVDSRKNGRRRLAAMGVAVPGVVEPDSGRVIVTPNMNLTGVMLGDHLEQQFGLPVAIGNDCNLGALGEKWLGSARKARSVVAILVGTGIGGGFVRKGKLWRGAREAACEIGHMVMQIGGPNCGCGNQGCLEALASRSAIERQIREAVAAGRETVLTNLCQGDLSVIRSSLLRTALESGDALTVEVLRKAAEVLGYACLTVRHLIDPEVIVLGGGVMEACGDFIFPIVEQIVSSDRLPGAREGGRVLLSALGDDAVVLGAVAIARRIVGRNPFKKYLAVLPQYPKLQYKKPGGLVANGKNYQGDVHVLVDGKIKSRDKQLAKRLHGSSHVIGTKELEELCRGGPELLVVGAGAEGKIELTDEARQFLERRAIDLVVLPTPGAVETFNRAPKRKAALIHVTC